MDRSPVPIRYDAFAEATLLAQERADHVSIIDEMTHAERLAAMHRGDLTLAQRAHWTQTAPDEVPLINGEFAWLAAFDPDVCEAENIDRLLGRVA